MSKLLRREYTNFEGWIPLSDVDSQDAKKAFLATLLNAKLENGWFQNARSYEEVSLPTNVSTQIAAGYTLIKVVQFTHSTQGRLHVYILWKGSASKSTRLKLYLGNTELDLDENNIIGGIDFTEAPVREKISASMVNDSLRLNLNCYAEYNSSVLLNLVLIYLEETSYGGNWSRRAGWYCFPRWLGWSYLISQVVTTELPDSFLDFEINVCYGLFNDEVCLLDSGGGSGIRAISTIIPAFHGDYAIKLVSTSTTYGTWMAIHEIKYPSRIEFAYFIPSPGATALFQLRDEETNELIHSEVLSETGGWVYIIYEFQKHYANVSWTLSGSALANSSDGGERWFDALRIKYNIDIGKAVVVAKYADGQRALLSGMVDGGLNKNSTLRIYKTEIDWRIKAYEVYINYEEDSKIYYLAFTKEITDSWDFSDPTRAESTFLLESTSETLNFNYGLGASVRVDNQRIILSEITYKNRTYFVNGDTRIYLSNIAGAGRIQPDSFPYDEDAMKGFLEPSKSVFNTALSVSITNDLIIHTSEGFQVYRIRSSGDSIARNLRLVNNNAGILNERSLSRSMDGSPSASGLYWVNQEGLHFYTGGVERSKNMAKLTHNNFWQWIDEQRIVDGIGFYDPYENEYWFMYSSTSSLFIVYEADYNKFRVYGFITSQILDFIGFSEDRMPMFLGDGKIFQLVRHTYEQSAVIETHYDDIGVRRAYNKILQEVYLEFKKETPAASFGGEVNVYVTVDGYMLPVPFKFSPADAVSVRLAPLSIRFQKIKFMVIFPSGILSQIALIGITYTEDGEGKLGQDFTKDPFGGVSGGYGYSYGLGYGN